MTNHYQTKVKLKNGFSLIELMIGLTLGLMITAAIMQLFIGTKQNYRLSAKLSEIQENGRLSLEILTNNLRMAGFSGCSTASTNTVTNVLNTASPASWSGADWWKNFGSTGTAKGNQFLSLVGYDGNQAFPITTGSTFGKFTSSGGDRVAGTDAIISLGGNGGYSVVTHNSGNSPPDFQLTTLSRPIGPTLGTGDMVIVCNNTTTSIFQVTGTGTNTIQYATGTSPSPGNSSTNLGSTYNPTLNNVAMMVDYKPSAFYIGQNELAIATPSGKIVNSLYQLQISATGTIQRNEIIFGVENMQIFYGVETSGDISIDQYVDATNVTNWNRVFAIRIYLLLSSQADDNLFNQSQFYFFPNDTGDSSIIGRMVQPSDRRAYKVFFTTISLRNRLNLP